MMYLDESQGQPMSCVCRTPTGPSDGKAQAPNAKDQSGPGQAFENHAHHPPYPMRRGSTHAA